MKKMFVIIAVTAIVSSCNGNKNSGSVTVNNDSIRRADSTRMMDSLMKVDANAMSPTNDSAAK